MSKDKIAVLITTDKDKKGVFMGLIDPKDIGKTEIVAEEIRMAVYWSADVKGVLGLANKGPSDGCRISPAAPRGLLQGVDAVFELSEDALKAWRKEPWSG